jgi:hypothetical protein
MVMNLRLRRAVAWWLLGVMLLGALAPTVSRARAWSLGSSTVWVEVCTTEGTRQIALDNRSDDAPGHPGTPMLDHCALCVLASDRLAPPPSPFEWQALPQAPPVLAAAFVPFSLSVLHWTVHSRAPPAHD